MYSFFTDVCNSFLLLRSYVNIVISDENNKNNKNSNNVTCDFYYSSFLPKESQAPFYGEKKKKKEKLITLFSAFKSVDWVLRKQKEACPTSHTMYMCIVTLSVPQITQHSIFSATVGFPTYSPAQTAVQEVSEFSLQTRKNNCNITAVEHRVWPCFSQLFVML